MAEIFDFNATDASNTARWPENMPFNLVNDAGRADEGILARWYQDTNGSRASSGSAGAFAVTSSRTIAALTDNLRMTFTANHSPAGTSTFNLNGLGAKSIKRWNGSATAQGDIVSGQAVDLLFKTGLDAWLMMSAPTALITNAFADFSENATPGNPAADVARIYAKDVGGLTFLAYRRSDGTEATLVPGASQAIMEAATSLDHMVLAGRQHFQPGHPKAWVNFNGTGVVAIRASYGVSSITDNGVGDFSVNLATAFSSADYGASAIIGSGETVNNPCFATVNAAPTATVFRIKASRDDNTNFDTTHNMLMFVGDFA